MLCLAGEGELRVELEALATHLGISDRVRFLGAIPGVRPYYRAADALVSTSVIGGLSMAYLEALAFGLPLVATNTGGTGVLLREGKNGFLFASCPQTRLLPHCLSRWRAADQADLAAAARVAAAAHVIERNVQDYQALLG